MAKYRKKPVVIEAFHVILGKRIPDWLMEAMMKGIATYDDQSVVFLIKTLEGVMRASTGDWIIKGVAGELYPCKPDIFEATYEEVADGS